MDQTNLPEPQAENLQPASAHEVGIQESVRDKVMAKIGAESTNDVKPVGVKEAFPLLGNYLFNMNGPVVNLERMRELMKQPELLALMKEQRRKILELTGVRSFSELKNKYKDENFTKKVRDHITKVMRPHYITNAKKALIDRLTQGGDEEGVKLAYDDLDERVGRELDRLTLEADEIIDAIVKKFFPETGVNSPIGLLNEVGNKADITTSVMMAFDEKVHPRDRFEALRRVAVEEMLISLDHIEEDRRKENRGLAYLDDKMTEVGLYQTGGYKVALPPETEYMVTEHSLEDSGCSGVKFANSREEAEQMAAMNEGSHVTAMALRRLIVEDEEGNPEEIKALVDSRIKSRLSMVLKMLRRNSDNPDAVLSDLNGIRMVFESEREIELFENSFVKKLSEGGCDVKITRTKEKIGKGKLSFKKHNIEVNGRKYEFQIMTNKEFADYLYKRPFSWSEYEVKRFFESSCSQALFPSDIYGDLDREECARRAQEKAYQMNTRKVWGDTPLQDEVAMA